MFLKKLYLHNKLLFLATVLFMMAYAYLNYQWGLSATPVQLYGMYSGKFKTGDTISLYHVIANGKRVNDASLDIIDRDLLQTFPEIQQTERSVNKQVYQTFARYFQRIVFDARSNEYKFQNHISDSIRYNWYKNKVATMLHEELQSLDIYQQHFTWKNDKLEPTDNPVKLNFY